jgi:hypothetical protein
MATETKKLVGVRLTQQQWRRFRVVLLRRGKTSQAVLEDYVDRYTTKHEELIAKEDEAIEQSLVEK